MFCFTRNSALFSWCILGLISSSSLFAEEMTLRQALAAAQTSSEERLSVLVAQARVRLLDSMGKRRFELRPQLGLLTLTQPLVTAASIGSGLLATRSWAPSNLIRLDARADLLATELAYSRRTFYKQVQTSRAFAELLQAQQAATSACEEWVAHERGMPEFDDLVTRHKLTMLDRLRYEQQTLERRSDCVDSDQRRKSAAMALSAMVQAPGAQLTAVLSEADLAILRPINAMIDSAGDAILRSSGVEELRRRVAEMRRAPVGGSRLSIPDFSLAQSNLKETGDLSGLPNNYLSGGNFLHPALSWKISLRDTGERKAEAEMLHAKLNKLEAELNDLEHAIWTETEALRTVVEGGQEKIWIAEKKLQIVSDIRRMTLVRFESGLALRSEVLYAEQQERRARNELIRFQHDHKARRLTLLILSGAPMPEVNRSGLFPVSGPEIGDAQ